MVYNADIYLAETGAAFKDRYFELLQAVAALPDPTIETLLAPGQSASAAHLRRLAAGTPAATPAAQASAASAAAPMALLPPEHARLAQVWASALSIDVNDIRSTDNFFDLGGDSLLAMRVLQQAEQVMGFRVSANRYVFENLRQLASAASGTPIEAASASASAAQSADGGGRRGGLLGRVFSGWGKKP
ncbi:MAG: acyl carrier protein [Variovorax sp.]